MSSIYLFNTVLLQQPFHKLTLSLCFSFPNPKSTICALYSTPFLTTTHTHTPNINYEKTNRLKQIHSIDLEGTTLKLKQNTPYTEGGTSRLMAHLHMRDQRKQAKLKMLERMREGVYRELWDVPGGQDQIMALIKEVFLKFENLDDIKNLIRNAERLFPENIEDVDIHEIEDEFGKLRREVERTKLAAELELKIRVIYFDRIRVDKVEGKYTKRKRKESVNDSREQFIYFSFLSFQLGPFSSSAFEIFFYSQNTVKTSSFFFNLIIYFGTSFFNNTTSIIFII